MKFIWLILIFFCFTISLFSQSEFDKRLERLVLRAKVLEINNDKSSNETINCKLKIESTLKNEGKVPIIILHSLDKSDGYSGASLLERNRFTWLSGLSVFVPTRYGDYPVFNNWALPSVCRECYEEIKKKLDKKVPPEEYAKILKPKESWSFTEEQYFSIDLKPKRGGYGFAEELATSKWKVYGRIGYSLLPNNLGENFRKSLKKRWQKLGILYFHGTHSTIDSEKFEIDLTKLKF